MSIKQALVAIALSALGLAQVQARDLHQIYQQGELRHIGFSYANFTSFLPTQPDESLNGLDVELIKGFADYLGVKYRFVPVSSTQSYEKLIGKTVTLEGSTVTTGAAIEVEGDLIAAGATMLDWREQIVSFSDPYFPSAVWLVARGDSELTPITPTGNIQDDIALVKGMLAGKSVLTKSQSCLDHTLYQLEHTGAEIVQSSPQRKLSEMVPSIINNVAETSLLDVPDALIALEKWPGEIKVIGPISEQQSMGVAFRNESVELRLAFNHYLAQRKADGSYNRMVQKYYPTAFHFYRDFFNWSEGQ